MELVKNRETKKKIVVNDIGLFIQIILIFCTIVLGILTVVENEFLVILELVLGFAILTMAYNNKKTYKRKVLTVPYIVVGLILIIHSIITYIGQVF
ncbi:MAG: hypothetical protein NC181_01800 [Clostridium sp.]|nr:hypothetical protein [Clostridium sp.]MCM1444041.1 hypothetical protein [Candidatus Amulumruptor caecigallinarius]